MKATQFHSLLKACGDAYLSASGWTYRKRIWQIEREGYLLSLIPADTKYGIHFQIKYLTLTLVHTAVTHPSGENLKPFDDNDQRCPVQISPMRLTRYGASGFSDWVWHQVLPHRNRWTVKAAYEAVYYGGPDKWILENKSASSIHNKLSLRSSVKAFGACVLTEKEVEQRVDKIAKQCAQYGFVWANHMTPGEVIRQLARYGDPWHAPEWLRAYEEAFADAERASDPMGKTSRIALRMRNWMIGF